MLININIIWVDLITWGTCDFFHCIWKIIVTTALQMSLDLEFPHVGNKWLPQKGIQKAEREMEEYVFLTGQDIRPPAKSFK